MWISQLFLTKKYDFSEKWIKSVSLYVFFMENSKYFDFCARQQIIWYVINCCIKSAIYAFNEVYMNINCICMQILQSVLLLRFSQLMRWLLPEFLLSPYIIIIWNMILFRTIRMMLYYSITNCQIALILFRVLLSFSYVCFLKSIYNCCLYRLFVDWISVYKIMHRLHRWCTVMKQIYS